MPPPSEKAGGAPEGATNPIIKTTSCHTGEVTGKASPLEGLVAVPCQCWPCRWHRACDKAIDLNGAVRLEGAQSIMVVADTVVAEVAANGGDIPPTYQLVRDDGRTVYVFHDEAAA